MHLYTSSFNKFTIALLSTFAVLTMLFIGLTEYLIRTQVIPNHNFLHYLKIFKTSQEVNASFGDSIMANGFSGGPNFLNLSMGGDNFAGMATKVRLYYKDKKPGKVILEAGLHHISSHHMFHRDNGDGFIDTLHSGGTPLFNVFNPTFRYEIFTYWRIVFAQGKFVPLEKYGEYGARLRNENYAKYPVYLRKSGANQTAKMWEPVANPSESKTIKQMQELVNFIKEKGGEVCLLTFPVSGDVAKATKDNQHFTDARKAFAKLAAENNIVYLDMYDKELTDNNFADFTHLNKNGAKTVSQSIVKGCGFYQLADGF